MIERVMQEAGLAPAQLDAVAAAIGPGGFTGIRVGLAAAHGIALAVGGRLVGISSFAAVAARMADLGPGAYESLLVALDSRRADLYVQLVARDLFSLCPIRRLEVDDRQLVGVEFAHQVDPAIYNNSWSDMDLNLLL